jgi:murein L,D-transpeptidase YafK
MVFQLRDRSYSSALRCAGAAALALALAACQDASTTDRFRAQRPIPSETIALMQSKNTDSHAPILIRTYKKEAEFEIWKMTADGTYTHLKTYPMCRWSGQLGPKTKEGDRQVPEGFYNITPGQMNPASNYYLSFNVGYPNAYDKVHNYTGGLIMVHGACSSAGCFSMTDEQIAEIYAIAREAFGGGQRSIQMQSFPFRMTAENLAKHRLDPNMPFWRELKQGSDRFEVTKKETPVTICNREYNFALPENMSARVDPQRLCPPLKDDPEVVALVTQKQKADEQQVAQLIQSGVRPVRLVYQDGGQHPDFMARSSDVSRPDALAQGPVEVPMDEPTPKGLNSPHPVVAQKGTETTFVARATSKVEQPNPAPSPQPSGLARSSEQPFYKKLFDLLPGT